MLKPQFPVATGLIRFVSGQRIACHVAGCPLTQRVERVFYMMWGEESFNDTVELSDHSWLSYTPGSGWRYFYPTGPLLGLPVLVDETGFAQVGYWRRFVESIAQRIGLPRRASTILLCAALLAASCKSAEVKHLRPAYSRPLRAFEDREQPLPDTTYFRFDNPKG